MNKNNSVGQSPKATNNSKPSNVIDLKNRRASRGNTRPQASPDSEPTSAAAEIVDMTARRNQILVDERRQVRRTILTEFIGAFAVIPNRGLQKVSLYDISEDGIAFDLDLSTGQMPIGEEIAMRVYLNQHTYFPFIIQVKNARAVHEEGVHRHGTSFVKGAVNEEALHHFVKFVETVSASLETDHGDVMVSNLRR